MIIEHLDGQLPGSVRDSSKFELFHFQSMQNSTFQLHPQRLLAEGRDEQKKLEEVRETAVVPAAHFCFSSEDHAGNEADTGSWNG